MTNKLKVLKRIADKFNENNITWAMAASVLLFFNGIVDEFHDLDIMIDDEDASKAKEIMDSLGTYIPSPENCHYKTKHFLEYVVDDVEVDVMGGFIIVKDDVDYDCSLKTENIEGYFDLDGTKIPLYSVSEWRRFYDLMGRTKKVEIIDNYYKNK